jgi:chemotaxis protein CheZ
MHAATEVIETQAAAAAAYAQSAGGLTSHEVFVRVGTLTRNLHDTLRQLGYDKGVEDAVGSLPDARARLDYIANLTGKAAERVLGATERAKAAQDLTAGEIDTLRTKWDALLGESPNSHALWNLGRETQERLAGARARVAQVDNELTDIMLAQDFHDLTGQMIQRITRLAQSLEEQLVKLLLDASPPAQRKEVLENAFAGPVVGGEGCDDVVTTQGQVDDLLESLGF